MRYITCRLLLARASQESCGKSASEVEDAAAFLLGDGADDPRLVVGRRGGGDVDRLGEVFAAAGGAGVEHERPAELDLVAAGEAMGADPLAVDEGAVGAVQIGDREIAVAAAEFGVMAGDFGVVNLEAVGRRRVPAGEWGPPARNACPDRFRG